MDWATRRRFVIFSVMGATVVALVAAVLIAVLYKAPSCSDGAQNQGEAGIDCGGPCPYLCSDEEAAPAVLFTKAFSTASGRASVLAYVENRNANAAAKAVPYTLALYGADQVLVGRLSGTLDLPPASTVPVYVPNAVSGKQKVAAAFLSIDPANVRWYRYREARVLPAYGNDARAGGTAALPRVAASVENPGATPLQNVRAVLAVRDSSGNVIAASSTILPVIPAQGSAEAIFTWNEPFPSTPASFELIPLLGLP